ncbi:MAG: hypothetical protein U1E87_01280 [Alphaproteobacteria bacterium]
MAIQETGSNACCSGLPRTLVFAMTLVGVFQQTVRWFDKLTMRVFFGVDLILSLSKDEVDSINRENAPARFATSPCLSWSGLSRPPTTAVARRDKSWMARLRGP